MKDEKTIKKAWNDFFINNKEEVSAIRDTIKESWLRTKEYKVDLIKQKSSKELEEKQKEAIRKMATFIDIVRPFMLELFEIIKETGFMITLIDKNGYILDTYISSNIPETKKNHTVSLSEKHIGTNAMGTSIYLDKPVETWGAETAYSGFHDFTTSAAPIHDKDNKLIGSIGITGYKDTFSTHTLGMVVAVAIAIENQLRLVEIRNDKYITKTYNTNKDKEENQLYDFSNIIGESHELKESINQAKIAAKNNSNILILGESGTGKELFAQAIHKNSDRANESFIAVNCGALPLSLAESELFGYERGSFTGAKKEGQMGKFEMADKGTIFLDEIGELPLAIQASLLRVIQDREVIRIGANTSKKIDVRIIAATNRNLFEAVEQKNFRMDLFYRINVFTINIPPLRKRREDISPLIKYFLNQYNNKFNTNIEDISDTVKNIFNSYKWPGNVRELENIIERAVQISENHIIEIKDLPINLQLKLENNNELNIKTLKNKEYNTIIDVINENKGNIKLTSEQLGISRATLYRKLDKYNIDINDYRR